MKVYFISGIGADRRAFRNICLPPGYDAEHLDWISPEPNESLENYSSRLAAAIPGDQQFCLLGLSFGGMIASEIARLRNPLKTIIISSVKHVNDLPWYYRRAGRLGIHKIVPISFYKAGTWLRRVMGVGSPEDKAIVYEYIRNVDPSFLKWSLDAILKWKCELPAPGIVHVHGSRDHLLPVRYLKPDIVIEKGGHLMVLNQAEEVNRVLRDILEGSSVESY